MDKKDITIITYASGEPYLSESNNLKNLCNKTNINFILYDSKWLHKTEFYTENKELLNSKKAGFCAWKPYIILDALKKYKKVLYLDSSMLFQENHISEYFDKDDPILSTDTDLVNKNHTKHLTFQIMNCLSEKYLNARQAWSGTILADKRGIDFLKEWLKYCKIKDCISDEFDKSIETDIKYILFDQSIYSILYEKYSLRRECNAQHGYFYFADTRELFHINSIINVFGDHYIKKQDNLITKYRAEYIANGSCCYNPEQIKV